MINLQPETIERKKKVQNFSLTSRIQSLLEKVEKQNSFISEEYETTSPSLAFSSDLHFLSPV